MMDEPQRTLESSERQRYPAHPAHRLVDDGIESTELRRDLERVFEPLGSPVVVAIHLGDATRTSLFHRNRVDGAERRSDLPRKHWHEVRPNCISSDALDEPVPGKSVRESMRRLANELDQWNPYLRPETARD
jgi:hypothetical protein